MAVASAQVRSVPDGSVPPASPTSSPPDSGGPRVEPAGETQPELTSRLRLATMRLGRLLRQHGDPDSGLSPSLISALATVSRTGALTLGRLAELERVQPPSMTRIVAQLEDRGLVERHTDARDRRIARVRATPVAERLLTEARCRKNQYLADRLAELSPHELRTIERALPAIERLAGEQR